MRSRDFYADARDLARRLTVAGFRAWATELEDTIAGGATSTEILMGLRSTLQRLVQQEAPRLDESLCETARELADDISVALG
jgi:hypothetical protein